MGYVEHMRMHIVVDDDLAARLDARAAKGARTGYVVRALRRSLDEDARWDALESAAGSIADTGHEWDDDPAAWVAAQRRVDATRVG